MPPKTRTAAVPRAQTPTFDEIEKWDRDKLIKWMQIQYPNLLDSAELKVFKKIKLSGKGFVREDATFFEECGIARGVAKDLDLIIKGIRRKAGKRKADFDDEEHNPKIFFPDISQIYSGVFSQCQSLPSLFN
jgi:hypothetical protein